MNVKEKLYGQLLLQIEERINDAKILMESHKESLQSDTKSTAGDKHETGRAMIQIEYEGSVKQYNNAVELKKSLVRINPKINKNEIGLGSLIITNHGNYFISVGLGNVKLEGSNYFAISFGSPIGMILREKKEGETFDFMNKNFTINSIY